MNNPMYRTWIAKLETGKLLAVYTQTDSKDECYRTLEQNGYLEVLWAELLPEMYPGVVKEIVGGV